MFGHGAGRRAITTAGTRPRAMGRGFGGFGGGKAPKASHFGGGHSGGGAIPAVDIPVAMGLGHTTEAEWGTVQWRFHRENRSQVGAPLSAAWRGRAEGLSSRPLLQKITRRGRTIGMRERVLNSQTGPYPPLPSKTRPRRSQMSNNMNVMNSMEIGPMYSSVNITPDFPLFSAPNRLGTQKWCSRSRFP